MMESRKEECCHGHREVVALFERSCHAIELICDVAVCLSAVSEKKADAVLTRFGKRFLCSRKQDPSFAREIALYYSS